MPRPLWKGQISFGLVHIPVSLFPAENRADLRFHMLDSRDKARVRYERVNEATGEEVPWGDVVKAFEYDDKNYVVIEDEDFKRAAVEQTKSVEIQDFVEARDIAPVYFDTPYYVTPNKGGERGYTLLREALKRSGKVGIAKVVIRTRQRLCALMAQGPMLVAMTLRFAQEIRDPAEYDIPAETAKTAKVAARELQMAEQLIESMSTKWKPNQYHDEYRDAVMKWIEQKAKAGGKMPAPAKDEADESIPPTFNIADLLQQSLSRKSRAAPAKRETKPKPKPRRRKAG